LEERVTSAVSKLDNVYLTADAAKNAPEGSKVIILTDVVRPVAGQMKEAGKEAVLAFTGKEDRMGWMGLMGLMVGWLDGWMVVGWLDGGCWVIGEFWVKQNEVTSIRWLRSRAMWGWEDRLESEFWGLLDFFWRCNGLVGEIVCMGRPFSIFDGENESFNSLLCMAIFDD